MTDSLTHLGGGDSGFGKKTEDYNPSLLEIFPSSYGRDFQVVTLQAHKFSHLCPKTGQPDWAEIFIRYIPDRYMVESKSLKLYLNSFRNHGSFHETCIVTICQDLHYVASSRLMEVYGLFTPRGDIAIYPHVILTDGSEKMDALRHDLYFKTPINQRHYGVVT